MSKKKSAIETIEVSLQSPWVLYGKKIIGLLGKDPSLKITTNYNEGRYTLYIDSKNMDKLTALSKILKNFIQMGNVCFDIEYTGIDAIPNTAATAEDWLLAFVGNGYFVDVVKAGTDPFTFYYAIFKREIISIFSDDLQDYCGNSHYIPADIVRDIINPSEVFPCTSAV